MAFDVNTLKESINHITAGNVVRLLSDFIIPNLDKVRNFSTTETYLRNDIVYMYDSTNAKHQLFICKVDRINPGAFDIAKWDVYAFRLQRSAILLESQYKAAADGVTNVPINLSLYDPDNDAMVVFHSINGKLILGTDWTLNINKTSIDLTKSLYQNESIYFEVFK